MALLFELHLPNSPSTPFHLILQFQQGEKQSAARSLSDLGLTYCGKARFEAGFPRDDRLNPMGY